VKCDKCGGESLTIVPNWHGHRKRLHLKGWRLPAWKAQRPPRASQGSSGGEPNAPFARLEALTQVPRSARLALG
jgi:hypothetical protein